MKVLILLTVLFLTPFKDRVTIHSLIIGIDSRYIKVRSEKGNIYRVPISNGLVKTDIIETIVERVEWKDKCKYTYRDTIFHKIKPGVIGQYLYSLNRFSTFDPPEWRSLP